MSKFNKKDVENRLNYLQTKGYFKDCSIVNCDGRLGKKIALAVVTDSSLDVKTDFISYSEMIQFIRGFVMGVEL